MIGIRQKLDDEESKDAGAANPFRLRRLRPGIRWGPTLGSDRRHEEERVAALHQSGDLAHHGRDDDSPGHEVSLDVLHDIRRGHACRDPVIRHCRTGVAVHRVVCHVRNKTPRRWSASIPLSRYALLGLSGSVLAPEP
jgi:hypothetical protein